MIRQKKYFVIGCVQTLHGGVMSVLHLMNESPRLIELCTRNAHQLIGRVITIESKRGGDITSTITAVIRKDGVTKVEIAARQFDLEKVNYLMYTRNEWVLNVGSGDHISVGEPTIVSRE